MNAPAKISKVELLRRRDGGKCWFCSKPINFKAQANSDPAWSVEHLIPQCRDGSDDLENLVLCHPPCNRSLKNLPLVEKVKLRDQLRDEVQKKKWLSDLRKRVIAQFVG